jgi:acetyl esterase/lipase
MNRHQKTLSCRHWSFLLLTAVSLAGLCGPLSMTAWGADQELSPAQESAATFEVQKILDVPYYQGPDADKVKHKLDLYLPRNHKDFPVIFFVHGGGWLHGDKSGMFRIGIYSNMGTYWAKHGVGMVVANYRLSPGVTHPEHIKDVARAFAWTHKNISQYGGRADQIFVSGHSAGGHLVALLATDDDYLKAEGLTLQAIRGAIPMSGVYSIPARDPFYNPMFGTNPKIRGEASPLSHARPDAPPFLIIYAENDLAMCGKEASENFCAALKAKKCPARALEVNDRNHVSILLKAGIEGDPVPKAMREFIEQQIHQKQARR